VLFEPRLRDGIADGTITVAFRRWRRSQVVAGNRYRTAARHGTGPFVVVEAVDVVAPTRITKRDARAAGFRDRDDLLANLRGEEDLPIYRIRLRRDDGADDRAELAASVPGEDDIASLATGLARMDAASADGPWTHQYLALIREFPGVAAGELAERRGEEKLYFKTRVRRLKERGLTQSLPLGYRLSPRGEAYLAAVTGSLTGDGTTAG
jgi:hypothetical protein